LGRGGSPARYVQNVTPHIEGFAMPGVHFHVGDKAVFGVKSDDPLVVFNVGVYRPTW
jgi:hypothetical protein